MTITEFYIYLRQNNLICLMLRISTCSVSFNHVFKDVKTACFLNLIIRISFKSWFYQIPLTRCLEGRNVSDIKKTLFFHLFFLACISQENRSSNKIYVSLDIQKRKFLTILNLKLNFLQIKRNKLPVEMIVNFHLKLITSAIFAILQAI